MVFWIAVAVLAATVTYIVTRPLLGWPETGDDTANDAANDAAAADIAVYKDQLREIDSDEIRGAISEGEAGAARNEISRRLIRAGDAPAAASSPDARAAANMLKPI